MKVTREDLKKGFYDLRLGNLPVIVHASLKTFGEVDGGAATVAEALVESFRSILTPAFTYKTMITPEVGPKDNGMVYGTGRDANKMAEFFSPDMPVDRLIGSIPEALRQNPLAKRSSHPILSFTGIHTERFLAAQTMKDPFGPIGEMERSGGWVLLLGVNHTVNTSIHYAEKLAGRRTFLRWALTPRGVIECPSFPGCSAGFDAIAPELKHHTRRRKIGKAEVQAVPLRLLIKIVIGAIKKDPLAYLCQQDDCPRCGEVRNSVQKITGR